MKVKCFDPMNATFSTWMAEYEKNEKITADIRVGRNIFKNVKFKDLSKITSGYSVYDVLKFNYQNNYKKILNLIRFGKKFLKLLFNILLYYKYESNRTFKSL